MFDLVTPGELLIDFICTDKDTPLTEGGSFIKKAGGAPANVCAALSRLGGSAAFAGKVGADPFGIFLQNTLREEGIDTSMLSFEANSFTTLAFVSLFSAGERDFVFSRGADSQLSYSGLDLKRFFSAKIIHFGSATALLGGPLEECYFRLLQEARDKKRYISFDPNYREDLWKGSKKDTKDVFIAKAKSCIEYADFVKVSEEELALICGTDNRRKAVEKLHCLGAVLAAVTLGKEGTFISNGRQAEIIPSVPVESVDSTGAGDAFVGAFLYKVSRLEELSLLQQNFNLLKQITAFANKAGAFVCTRYGALPALPTLEELEDF